MPNALKRLSPLSVRLSPAERTDLENRAGELGLSSYVKWVLFDASPGTSDHAALVHANRKLLAHLLATLGASRIAPNLDRLAREAELGLLYDDEDPSLFEDTRERIVEACDDIRLVHNALMRALGLTEREPSGHEQSAAKAFNANSGSSEKP